MVVSEKRQSLFAGGSCEVPGAPKGPRSVRPDACRFHRREPLSDKWEELIGNCSYICKPATPFVIEWYDAMLEFLSHKHTELQLNPALKFDFASHSHY